jgi:hypothetical protein
LFVPWAPSFVFQLQHTGTPWSVAASPTMMLSALQAFTGWPQLAGMLVFGVYGLSLLVLAAAIALRSRELPWASWAVPTAAVFVVGMTLAMAAGLAAGAAFAYRYASIVLPPVVVLVGMGLVAIGRSRIGAIAATSALLAVAVLGTSAGASEILARRTQAVEVAADLNMLARPGDVIAYCPDQLGPAVSRLLPSGSYTQVTFPRFDDPSRINWVDYAQVNAAANPAVFARQLLNLAGAHQLWLVWEGGYRTLGQSCQRLRNTLQISRPDWSEPVHSTPSVYYEHENLVRFLPE